MKQELSSFSFIFYLLFVDQALSWTIYCNVSSSPFSEKPHARVIQTPLKELPLPPDDINLVQNQDLSCTFQRFKVVFTYSPKKDLDKLQRHASSYRKVMNLYSSTPHYHCVFECLQCYSSMTDQPPISRGPHEDGAKNCILQKTAFSLVKSRLALGSPGCLVVRLVVSMPKKVWFTGKSLLKCPHP